MTKPKEAQLDLLLTISEGLSKRPYEMLQVSPTDAIHAPSCGLAIREAADELRWMRAEVERLRAANLQLMNGIDTITLRLREEKEATIAWLRDRQKPTVKDKP